MSSNTDEPQLTRRQMRERRGVDTHGVPVVDAADGSTPGDSAPASSAARSRRVSTSAAIAGGAIPDMQAAERAAEQTSTPAEQAEAARQTSPALSLAEIAELEKKAQAGLPLTRRQARDLEKAKTASVPVISADDAAADRAASEAARQSNSEAARQPIDTPEASRDAATASEKDASPSEAPVKSDAATDRAADEKTAVSGDAAVDDTAASGDVAPGVTQAKAPKLSKRAEKKAAQEAKRAEEAAREATAAEARAAEKASEAAASVAPIRPAFIGKPADADEAPAIAEKPAPRRSSYTAVAPMPPAERAEDTTPAAPAASKATASASASVSDVSAADGPVSASPSNADSATESDDETPKLVEGFGAQVLEAGAASSTATPHDQPFDRIIARGVEAAEAQAASNALILPTMPTNDSLTGPISSNGNVIVTGSIDLPASLSTTGQHPNYFDKAELDTMFEADEDAAAPATAGTPVSAARAVSTHTQTGDVINPPAPSRDHRLLIILAITAGALLTAVLAVVIVGFVVGAF